MDGIIKNIEVFLQYGPIGILALYMIITYFKERGYMKIMMDNILVMNEMKMLLQELVWKKTKEGE